VAAAAPGLPLFLCGALTYPQVAAAVSAAPLAPGRDALLRDHALVWSPVAVEGLLPGHPNLVPRAGAGVSGVLVDLGPEAMARHAAFTTILGARLEPREVETASGMVTALVALAAEDAQAPGARDWVAADWVDPWAAILAGAAEAVLSVAGREPLAALRLRYPMALARASSRLRAAAAGDGPARLRRVPALQDVAVDWLERPYQSYFAVEEAGLRVRRFDGAPSPELRRAVFAMADAVAVLPYDPVRDRVLLIEQFRPGPFLRGDPNPWLVEAIAGRIDPGETAADAARREAEEEAGLALGELIPLPGHYPSPGAVTEFIEGFIGLVDLPDSAGGLGGLASEHEDIRSHVTGFDDLMALVESGEVGNGPLVILALWLARLRPGLRAAGSPGSQMPRA
jgi:ADP-ribose pyrophosphatase